MAGSSESLQVRRIAPNAPAFRDVLHAALGVEPPSDLTSAHPAVEDFLSASRMRGIEPDLVFAAYRAGRLEAACAALESPGASALVYSAVLTPPQDGQEAAAAALRALVEAARSRQIALLEALTDPHDLSGQERLERAGFRFLTRLIYLRRRSGATPGVFTAGLPISWVNYSGNTHSLFLEAIEASYCGSRDCPELSGIRPTEDVLAGHRAVGEFDPSIWWVGLWSDRPVAVILLSKLPRSSILEVVYMGVVSDCRGRGLADLLMAKAVEFCRVRSAAALALAVDERNAPARCVYERWGFVETGVRSAWIASPLETRA